MRMLHFNTQSWHYRLVLYVFGKNFFLERDTIDLDEFKKTNRIIWTKKPKIINFCPYCRGVLYSAISLPFVYIWRLLPHKERKELSHEETKARMKRRGLWIKCIASGIQFPLAVVNIVAGNYSAAIFQIIFGILLIGIFLLLPYKYDETAKILGPPLRKYVWPVIKPIVNFISKYLKERKHIEKEHKVKNPSIIKTYLDSKHSAICPVVCFIDKVDQEKLQ